MQYNYTSLREVIGNVIRNTRIQDSSFIEGIHEWLYEAMDQLETEFTLEGKCKTLDIRFHKAALPCGLKWIDGVEYQGHRLCEGGSSRPAGRDSATGSTRFISYVDKQQTTADHTQYIGAITALPQLQTSSELYYYTEMGTMNTSFPDGQVTLYYRSIATDEDGFPMIPDNAAYKQALYWYCRAMMIGAGWKDTIFTYDKCMEQFEKLYGPRALAEIRLPSPEQMEHRVNTYVRMVPDSNYYNNFFHTQGREDIFNRR